LTTGKIERRGLARGGLDVGIRSALKQDTHTFRIIRFTGAMQKRATSWPVRIDGLKGGELLHGHPVALLACLFEALKTTRSCELALQKRVKIVSGMHFEIYRHIHAQT
jgi:hypothetical protein